MYVPRASMVQTHMLANRGLHCPEGFFSGGACDGLGWDSVVMVTGLLGFRTLASGSTAGNVAVSGSAGAEAATGTTVRLRISEGALGNEQRD